MIKAKHLLLLVAAMAMVLATAPLARAVALDFDDGIYYLGMIIPGLNASEVNEAGFINELRLMAPGTGADSAIQAPPGQNNGVNELTRSNTIFAGILPEAEVAGAMKDEDGPFLEIAPGWDYILAKYGQGESHVWYIGLLTEMFTIPTSNLPGQGLSHYTLFNPRQVPDGGKTLLLLGLGLAGMVAMRRRIET